MRYIANAVFGVFDFLLLLCVIGGLLMAIYVMFKTWFGIDVSIFYRAVFNFIYQR